MGPVSDSRDLTMNLFTTVVELGIIDGGDLNLTYQWKPAKSNKIPLVGPRQLPKFLGQKNQKQPLR